jgi:hypothetical protein
MYFRCSPAKVGGGRRGGGSVGDVFSGASARQQSLLDQAMARSSSALAQIRQYDPDWKPRESSLTRPGNIEGAIAEAEARARESEAHLDQLRSGIGGNLGPPLDPPRQSVPSMRPFDGQGWIKSIAPSTMSPIYSASRYGDRIMERLLPLRSMESCILA